MSQGPLRECCLIWPGASGLPYYCTPLVCVPSVIGGLATWHNNKNKNHKNTWISPCFNINIRHFKTTFMCWMSIAGVPSGHALPGYPITAHHVYAFPGFVMEGSAVWWYNKSKTRKPRVKAQTSVCLGEELGLGVSLPGQHLPQNPGQHLPQSGPSWWRGSTPLITSVLINNRLILRSDFPYSLRFWWRR